jgi:hypothetical protein
MRREPEHFEDQEVELVYIAKKLAEALALEELLTSSGIDYLVETDQYIGAFFYVLPGVSEPVRQLMQANGYRPQRVLL